MQQFISRMARYTVLRAVVLLLVLVVAVYLTIIIVNMGGAMDDIRISQIRFEVSGRILGNPELQHLPASELRAMVDEETQRAIARQGLDRPFLVRSFEYLRYAMTLELGRAESLISDSGSQQVRDILLERLPATLLLFAVAELFLFFFGLSAALFLSRRYGSLLDRLTIALAPTSAAPGWFYGLFLILIFAAALGVLPWGGMVEKPVPRETLPYALSVLQHLVLPVAAIVIGAGFATIYSWRTFFLIYSSEDYVELARAKGLSSQRIERRYILRPTLPPIITTFLLMIITMWTGAIILETVFNWPGLGRLLYMAIGMSDTPVIVGSVVIFGYLLVASVFLLDFIYMIVDPRVRVGAGGTR